MKIKRIHTAKILEVITPTEALRLLKEGNERFVNNQNLDYNFLAQVDAYKDGQFPFSIILNCMDSRTSTEHIFNQALGKVFHLRVAGNVLNDDIIGSMEYACNIVGTKLIVVLGHSKCGAITGACQGKKLGKLTQLLDKIRVSIDAVKKRMPKIKSTHPEFIEAVVRENIIRSLDGILERSAVLQALYEKRQIGLAGAHYDVATGKVTFIKELMKSL